MSSFRGNPGFGTTKELIQAYTERACDPSLHEPNMSLDLEIADLINTKKANTPREAAVEVIKLINHRNTHIAMLALHLLDILVKNCGYPFHLQISTKDFLNELVRRFPERPPVFPPPPMAKVLELIHEWKNTLCVNSKYKEDLVHIRDMHRLLSYKGYRFGDFDKRHASVLNPSESLQTPDELEEEDRSAQAAKLQELIRRGTPKDLAAAQELMKVMSGAEPEKRPDYEGKVQSELDRIQSRILLLNEMLSDAKPTERFADGDAFDQIARKCRSVQPKIQKWIEESAENDPTAIDRLLLINDLINNILLRYTAFKAGDRSATADVDASFSSTTPARAAPKPQVSLIDFDFDEPAPAPPTTTVNSTIDDLSSLSLSPSSSQSQQEKKQDVLSLFDLSPMGFSTTTSNSQISGSYFSNPPPPSSSSMATNSLGSNQGSAINWGGASSPSLGRPTTPGGAISLGGMGNSNWNTLPSSTPPPMVANGGSSNGAGKGKAPDPFGDLLDLKF